MQTTRAAARLCIVVMTMLAWHWTPSVANAEITYRGKPIRLPEVRLKNATLDEAVAYLNAEVAKLAIFDDMHLNVVVLGSPKSAARINLDLREVPVKLAFEQVAQMAGMRVRIEDHALVLAPLGSPEPIRTRIYRVPPDFISSGSAAK